MLVENVCAKKQDLFFIVLFVIPVVLGATVAMRRISRCTAMCEPFICFSAIVGCFIHWCHVKCDETTRIHSEIWASFRSICCSGAATFCLLPTEKMMRKYVVCRANNFTRRHPATSCAIKLEAVENSLRKLVRGMLRSLCLDNLLPNFAHSLSYFFSATEPFPAWTAKASRRCLNTRMKSSGASCLDRHQKCRADCVYQIKRHEIHSWDSSVTATLRQMVSPFLTSLLILLATDGELWLWVSGQICWTFTDTTELRYLWKACRVVPTKTVVPLRVPNDKRYIRGKHNWIYICIIVWIPSEALLLRSQEARFYKDKLDLYVELIHNIRWPSNILDMPKWGFNNHSSMW